MPIKAAPQFTAWSNSRLSDYEKCPLLAKLKHLDKSHPKEPETAAQTDGQAAHKDAEDFGAGRLKKLPESLKLFPEEFKELAKHRKILKVEQQLAVNAEFKPADWFGRDAWLRVVLDATYSIEERGRVIDYKNGKVRAEDVEQLELYAIVKFAHEPHLLVVDTELWYLAHGELTAQSFTKAEAEKLKPKWQKAVKKMMNDRTFKPTPGGHCRWCWFGQAAKQDKGGPGVCKY